MGDIQVIAANDEPALAERIEVELRKPLDMRKVSNVNLGAKGDLDYIPWNIAVEEANDIFGYLRWSYTVREFFDLNIDSVPAMYEDKKDGNKQKQGIDKLGRPAFRWTAEVGCLVRVEIYLDGGRVIFREELGYGHQYGTSAADRFSAISQARYTAVSTGLKRAFRTLGNRFGLALYVKDEQRGDRVISAEEAAQLEIREQQELNRAAAQVVAAAASSVAKNALKEAPVAEPSPVVVKPETVVIPEQAPAAAVPSTPPPIVSEPVPDASSSASVDHSALINQIKATGKVDGVEQMATLTKLGEVLAANPAAIPDRSLIREVQKFANMHDPDLRRTWKEVLGRDAAATSDQLPTVLETATLWLRALSKSVPQLVS